MLLAFQHAVTVGATVLPVQGGRFVRPSPHSAYTYTPSGASPAQLASPCFGPLRCGPDRDRAWHLWSSSSRSVAPRPRSRSPRRLSRRLHGVTRRNASSAEYRLLALRRVPPRIRRTEPLRVAQLATRHAAPLPHHMLNPFKPPQQPLIDSITAGRRLRGKSDTQAVTNAQTGLLQLFRGDCSRYFLQFFLRQQIPLLCSLPKPLNRLSFVCRDTFAI